MPDVSGHLRGPSIDAVAPQGALAVGQCALGLAQFKAVGLGEVFDLMTAPTNFPLRRELLLFGYGGRFLSPKCVAFCYTETVPG